MLYRVSIGTRYGVSRGRKFLSTRGRLRSRLKGRLSLSGVLGASIVRDLSVSEHEEMMQIVVDCFARGPRRRPTVHHRVYFVAVGGEGEVRDEQNKRQDYAKDEGEQQNRRRFRLGPSSALRA